MLLSNDSMTRPIKSFQIPIVSFVNCPGKYYWLVLHGMQFLLQFDAATISVQNNHYPLEKHACTIFLTDKVLVLRKKVSPYSLEMTIHNQWFLFYGNPSQPAVEVLSGLQNLDNWDGWKATDLQ